MAFALATQDMRYSYHSSMRLIWRVLFGLMVMSMVIPGIAAETTDSGPLHSSGDVLTIQAAPGVIHLNPDPDHARHSWLIGAEWQRASRWLAGYAYFNNSYGQKSHYLYGGRWWPVAANAPEWYVKLTGGVIAGYKPPFEDKIPFNHDGIAPGLIPAVGYKASRLNIQMNFLGRAGLMVTFGYDLIQ